MRLIYQAQNSVEAHLLLNLFNQAGLTGRIDGEYLQGGMGELQVSGIVRVMIAQEDYEQAKEIVMQWESKGVVDIKSNSKINTPENKPNNSFLTIKWKYFLLITMVSLIVFVIIFSLIPVLNSGCFLGARPINRINDTTIIGVTEEVHKLLSIELSNKEKNIQNTSLDQAGLVNGKEIIEDYVKHGETGVALEHLFYMYNALEGYNVNIPSKTADSVDILKNEFDKLQSTTNNEKNN